LLDYQNRLAASRLDYVKALIDYQIALIRLDQAEGVTLAKNNITMEN
jgi:outer membrane protein TolC